MALLRRLFGLELGGDPDEDTAVAEGACSAGENQNAGEEIDPMDGLDDLAEVVPDASKKNVKKKPKARDTCRAAVLDLEIPKRPECTGSLGPTPSHANRVSAASTEPFERSNVPCTDGTTCFWARQRWQ